MKRDQAECFQTVIKANRNAAGTYEVGEHLVYVDTKGNDRIKSIRILD